MGQLWRRELAVVGRGLGERRLSPVAGASARPAPARAGAAGEVASPLADSGVVSYGALGPCFSLGGRRQSAARLGMGSEREE